MITVLLRPEDLAGDRLAKGKELARLEIEGATYRHLFRARRLAQGVRLRVVDGRGQARWAEVERVERRMAALALGAPAPGNEPAYRLCLVVAALRSERASWLVEKATEIGVRAIRFVATERTPRKYAPASLDRLRRVAAAAVQQSHRSWLPEISGVDPWQAVTASLAQGPAQSGDLYYLDPDPSRPESLRARGDSGTVLIGPEGGFSRSETRELDRLGCRAAALGNRTLRVETAAIAAAARLLLLC